MRPCFPLLLLVAIALSAESGAQTHLNDDVIALPTDALPDRDSGEVVSSFQASQAENLRLMYMSIVSNELIANQLQLSENQIDSIEKLQSELKFDIQRISSELKESLGSLTDSAAADAKRKAQSKANELIEAHIGIVNKKILLDHQVKALQRIASRTAMKGTMATSASWKYWPETLSSHLGLNTEETKDFKAQVDKALEEYEKDLEAAKKKAIDSMLKKIPRSKQEEVRDLLSSESGFLRSPKVRNR